MPKLSVPASPRHTVASLPVLIVSCSTFALVPPSIFLRRTCRHIARGCGTSNARTPTLRCRGLQASSAGTLCCSMAVTGSDVSSSRAQISWVDILAPRRCCYHPDFDRTGPVGWLAHGTDGWSSPLPAPAHLRLLAVAAQFHSDHRQPARRVTSPSERRQSSYRSPCRLQLPFNRCPDTQATVPPRTEDHQMPSSHRSCFATSRRLACRDTPWCCLLADGLDSHGNRRGGSCGGVNLSRRGTAPESRSSGWTDGADETRVAGTKSGLVAVAAHAVEAPSR